MIEGKSARIGIVGAGIMGVTLGYFLARQGAQVEIFEGSTTLGGLAGPHILEDGTSVDRYYHAILPSDVHLRELCTELAIADKLRFRETRMGFYFNGQIHPMNGIVDFLRFPPLGWTDRFRLGLTVLAAQRIKDWQKLEQISVQDWLVRWGGKNTYTNIWRPMLKAKFDGGFDRVPATWVWSRLVRMKSTRKGASQKEQAGHLIGGYITLLQAMAHEIDVRGGQVNLSTPIQEILIENGAVLGLKINGEAHAYDAVVATVQAPVVSRLIPGADESYQRQLNAQEYLSILCPLLVLDRPLSGYWTLNITDDRIPFTGVIETTTYIDPQYVGGHHLVYLPKYTAPESAWFKISDNEVREMWLKHIQQMFPDFRRESIRHFLVHRARLVEPIHPLYGMHLIPSIATPIRNLFLVNTAQIYPELTNGESVTRHYARRRDHTC